MIYTNLYEKDILPKFKGLHTHERAIESREVEHGVSIIFKFKFV